MAQKTSQCDRTWCNACVEWSNWIVFDNIFALEVDYDEETEKKKKKPHNTFIGSVFFLLETLDIPVHFISITQLHLSLCVVSFFFLSFFSHLFCVSVYLLLLVEFSSPQYISFDSQRFIRIFIFIILSVGIFIGFNCCMSYLNCETVTLCQFVNLSVNVFGKWCEMVLQ